MTDAGPKENREPENVVALFREEREKPANLALTQLTSILGNLESFSVLNAGCLRTVALLQGS